ncbi:MAG: PorV/PorQ family protein [Endomicrobiales bacterium]|nr:PorV/PorQ family protein [Endomicrobiales bacterium]
MFKKFLVVAMAVCMATTLTFAASKGTSGAQFLKIIAAPRPAAMGGAYAAMSDDVNSIVFNPSGLAFLKKKEAVLVQNSWIQDISNQYLAFGMPTENMGTFGLSVIMLSITDIDHRDNLANDLGSYDARDMAVSLAYARCLNEQWGVGLNAKIIQSKIEDESASAFAVDIGGLYKVSERVDLGLVIQNLGTEVKFISEGDPLPMTVRLGGGYTPINDLLLGLDVVYPNDSDIYASIGGEYNLKVIEKFEFPIRAGYRSGMETGGLSGLNAGLGVLYNNFLGVDFTWTPVGDLGDSMKFGLRLKF